MTRINVGIKPQELPDKLLLAEHREIKRIPNTIRNGRYNLEGIPEEFCLGKGHVKFFYNKLGYLLDRYLSLYNECKNRGFKVEYYGGAWYPLPLDLINWYNEQPRDREIILQRFKEKGHKLLT